MENVFMMLDDLYLNVPFSEKERAKDVGAKWDHERKLWYAPKLDDPLKYREWWSFLDVPYEEKDDAKALGATFHGDLKKWYLPQKKWQTFRRKEFKAFVKWWPDICGQFLFDDRYICVSQLNIEGGQADVFKAEDLETSTICAVKVFKPTSGSDEGKDKEALNREWKALEKLRGHKNILELYSYGNHEVTERFFLITPWKDLTLASFMRENQAVTKWPEAFNDILLGILDGLIYAFDNEIIHRDLKPDNIFLDHIGDKSEGGPYIPIIGDFGVSKIKDTPPSDVTFVMGGSEPWTPWRDIRDSSDELQHQNTYDVYSWGAIAIALITGAMPTSYDELKNLLDQTFKKEMGEEFHKFFSSCISLDPSDRPRDVIQLKERIMALDEKYGD